jgi:hypothetical protein
LQANDCRAMDNGKEFTDRLFASRARAPSGEHEFDLLCAELGMRFDRRADIFLSACALAGIVLFWL